MLTLNPISGAFDMVGLTQTSADARYVKKSGDTMTGLLQFSGTTHAGLQLNSLTTTQRDALTPANGMLLYNSTASQMQKYENSQWVDVSKSPATKVVAPAGSGYAADYYTTGAVDSSLLQTAFNAAAGGSLYIKAGIYDIDTTLLLPSDIKIITDGWNTIFRMRNSSNTSCMTNSDHTNGNTQIKIYGLQIDMNSANNTTMTSGQAINLTNVTDSFVDEVYIHHIRHVQGMGNVAIGMNKTYNCAIRNNKIYQVGDYGIATNGIQECKIIDNYIQNPAGHGISLEHGDFGGSNERATGNTVTNNTVYYDASETLTVQQGIKIGTIDNSIISDNTLYCTNKNGGVGIASSETTPGLTTNTNYQKGNAISNNTIYGFLLGGIKAVGSLWDSISGNTITLPYVASSSSYGILLDISQQSGDQHISEEVQVTGNTIIEETNTTLTSNNGIVVQGGSSFINISDNIIYNLSNNGITTIGGSNYINISGNTIRNSRRSAVYLGAGNSTGSSYCSITNNTISGSSLDSDGAHSDIELHGACLYTKIADNNFSSPNANKALYCIDEVDVTVDYSNINDNIFDTTSSGNDVHIQGVNSVIQNINTVTTRAYQITSISGNGANIVLNHIGATNPKKFIRSRGGALQVIDNGYGNALLTILDAGRTGLKGITSPTAWMHLPAGVAAASGAPLKFTSGISLTTPEAGVMEFDGSHLYFTISSTRYQIDQQGAAAGDIVGPASAVDNNVVFFDGTTGKLVKDSGLTLSGSNTGDQTITLTGNVTGSGTGSFATTIASGVVTNAMLAGSITASKLVGTDIATVGTITTGVWNGTKVAEVYGGTNQSTYTLGDVLYSSAANTLSKLAGNTTSTKKFLRQTGNGTISAAPAWDTLVAGDIPDLSGTYQPLDSDLTTIAGLIATTDNFLVSASSAWASRTPTQVKSTLSLNNVENTALSTWAGSSNITTLGTITTGTWTGTTIAVANGGTGQTSYTNGQLLIGNTTGNTLTKATLTGTSNQITVTNGTGSITLSTPQDIATGSSPTFVGLTLSGASVFTSASAANVVPLTINQNDTTNNPVAFAITNTGSGDSFDINCANKTLSNTGGNLRIFTTNTATVNMGGTLVLGGYYTGTTTQLVFGGIAGRKENSTDANTRSYLQFFGNGTSEFARFSSDGDFGIGGAGPVATSRYNYRIALVATTAKAIGMERIVTSNTAGNTLTIQSQGATSGATDKNAGSLILASGIATGTGSGSILFQTSKAQGSTNTTDNAVATVGTFDGTGNLRIGDSTAPTATLDVLGKFLINSSGLNTKYNNITTVSNGIPSEVATIDTTGLTANVGATTLYTTPAAAGMYRVSAYVVETTAGSLSSTLPNVQIVYTDSDSNTSVTIDATPVLGVAGIGQTGALTANTVGTVSTGVIVLYVKASTTIQYQTVNYASNLSGMTYALRIKLEAM